MHKNDLAKLKQLKKALRNATKKPVVKTPTASISLSDHELFMRAINGVKPLTHPYIEKTPKSPSPWPKQGLQQHLINEATESMTDFWPWDELETDEQLMFTRPGVSLEILKKLKRGNWPAQAELDLHGHTTETARALLVEFLLRSVKLGFRCVRIIHGKGLSSPNNEPILKLKTKNWLAQRDEVLAYTQAKRNEGGGGAVVVLLRSTK